MDQQSHYEKKQKREFSSRRRSCCLVSLYRSDTEGAIKSEVSIVVNFFFNHLPMDIYVMNHTFYKVIIDNLRNVRFYLLKAMLHFLQRIWGKSPCTL